MNALLGCLGSRYTVRDPAKQQPRLGPDCEIDVAHRECRWSARLVSGREIALAEIGSAVVGVVSWGLADVDDAPCP